MLSKFIGVVETDRSLMEVIYFILMSDRYYYSKLS